MNDRSPELTEERRARNRLDEIIASRQIVFITGKGGVGKSVVSAALALRARSLGLRPVLFECDAPTRKSLLPGSKQLGPELSEVAPGILGINQRSDDAIRDYAASTLPSRTVADLLFENRVARMFLQAAPSVTEMALVGRIALLGDRHGAEGPIIVDLHATGHAISLLRAPAGIMKVLRAGALFDRAQKIDEMLRDPARSAFLTVAVPEELPVSELLELSAALDEMGAPQGPVIVNGVLGSDLGSIDDAALAQLGGHDKTAAAAADLIALRAWGRRSARECGRLRDALTTRHGAADIVTLPFLVEDGGDPLAARIATELGRPAGGQA